MSHKDLYFLRHGVAADRETWELPDEERPLTDEGVQKMIRAVKGLKKCKLSPQVLMSSPLARALQTAQIVKTHLSHLEKIEIEEDLRPGGSLPEFLKKIRKRKEGSFLLVGHEPFMSLWVQALLGIHGTGTVRLKKGGFCHLAWDPEVSPPRAELISLLPPRVLRQMA
jgi:phosphohistidine phosphatase